MARPANDSQGTLIRPVIGTCGWLALGLLATIAFAILPGLPSQQYNDGQMPLIARYDPKLGIEGGRYARSISWWLTVRSVKMRDGETIDAPSYLRAMNAATYAPDLSWVTRDTPVGVPLPPPPTWWNDWRSGFPFRAMACEWTDGFRGQLTIENGWTIPSGTMYGVPKFWVIPGRILWLGFIADTVMLAAAFFTAWSSRKLPGFIARKLRTRPGQCPRCGYDQQGLDDGAPCPECGARRG